MERQPHSARRYGNRASVLAPVCLALVLTGAAASDVPVYVFPEPAIDDLPKHYICSKTDFSIDIEHRRFEEPGKIAVATVGKGGPGLDLSSKRGPILLLRLPRHFKPDETEQPEN